jgi:hypothetical protein
VDTGSEDSIDDDLIRSSPVTQKTTLGSGLGTSYEDVSGVYDTVVIGPFTFRHVWGPAGAIAIVGMEMMRRFTLTFDTRRVCFIWNQTQISTSRFPPRVDGESELSDSAAA